MDSLCFQKPRNPFFRPVAGLSSQLYQNSVILRIISGDRPNGGLPRHAAIPLSYTDVTDIDMSSNCRRMSFGT